MPTNPNDNKGGDLAELTGLEDVPSTGRRVKRNNDPRDEWQRQATKGRVFTAQSRQEMNSRLSDKAGLAFRAVDKPTGADAGRGDANAARATNTLYPKTTGRMGSAGDKPYIKDSPATETDLHASNRFFEEDHARVSFMAGRQSVNSADDLALVKPTSQLSTIPGAASRVKSVIRGDYGRGLANKARKVNTETAGDVTTRGVSKSAIGSNKGPDMGREKAAETAISPKGYAIEQAASLSGKASSALKGGGGEGESEKLSELGQTQDELNKTRKAMKGFSIVPEGF